jgi:hypothetical protein
VGNNFNHVVVLTEQAASRDSSLGWRNNKQRHRTQKAAPLLWALYASFAMKDLFIYARKIF